MTGCKWTVLSGRTLIRVQGAEAQVFLQRLVTTDVSDAGGEGATYTALLTPQGKILFDFFIIADVDGFLIDVAADRAKALLTRLTFYKLRADVTLELVRDELIVAAQWGTSCPELIAGFWYADPRVGELGSRIVIEQGDKDQALVDCMKVSDEEYHAHRIGIGVPEGGSDFAFEDVFPHEANMDHTHGVDFKKGCFVGQEVVSRMEHRGTARKRFVRVASVEGALSAGDDIASDGHSIGKVGSVSGRYGLALVRLDRAAHAIESGQDILAGDVPVKLSSPAYADFGLPS